MLYKLFLEKNKKDAIMQKKSKIDFIFTTSIAILLCIFGIFTSHYNSGGFTNKTGVDNVLIISSEVDNKDLPEINSNESTNKLNDVITPVTISATPLLMMFHLNSTPVIPASSQADTAIVNIFQNFNLDHFKIDYSIDGAKRSASTQN